MNTGSARSARSYEPLAEEPKARELQIDERIADNVGDFLENHVLQLRLSSPDEESRGLDEEGKKKLESYTKILHTRVQSLHKPKTAISKAINKSIVTTRNFTAKVPNEFQTMH